MPVDRSGHATGTLIVGANGKLAAPVRPGKVNLADTPATLLGKNVGKGVKPITFRGQGGLIYANGQKFAIKGANWFGSEDRNGPMQGLDEHSITFYLAFLRQHGFNAVRLLFNHESVLSNAKMYTRKVPKQYHKFDHAPELEGLTYVEMFAEIASQAAEYGLLVLIACHRTTPSAWPGQGKWYDGKITEARVLQSWTKLAGTLCGHWNVFAADIQNEPWSASWGMGRGSDWNVAASRIGNHVLGKCPRWLIFVEGVGHTPGAAGQQPNAGYWWGGNLVGVHTAPVKLKDQSRLVYSPHTYGPSVYLQDYFKVNNFPSNMAQIWNDHWAFVRQATGTPIVIGEIGGFYTQKDRVWQDWAVQFCGAQGIGLFYFALNPTSDDTGGLLRADWTTPEAQKLANLARLPPPTSSPSCRRRESSRRSRRRRRTSGARRRRTTQRAAAAPPVAAAAAAAARAAHPEHDASESAAVARRETAAPARAAGPAAAAAALAGRGAAARRRRRSRPPITRSPGGRRRSISQRKRE